MPSSIDVKSTVSGKVKTFRYTKTDYDDSHEDIAGWRYHCYDDALNLLIIND